MIEHQPRRPWIKLWTQEYIHGTTRTELKPDERSLWTDFMALAGDSPKLGFICIAEDIPYTDEQLAKLLKVDVELLQRATNKMIQFNKIRRNGTGVIEIVNFWKYQPEFDRTEYQRKYMEKYRADKRASKTNSKSNTSKSNVSKTYDGKTPYKEERRGEGKRKENTNIDKPTTNEYIKPNSKENNINSCSNNKQQQNYFIIYEQNIGLLTQKICDELTMLEKEYPFEWFNEAVKEACKHNIRNLAYIQKILESWNTKGFKVDTRKKNKEVKQKTKTTEDVLSHEAKYDKEY